MYVGHGSDNGHVEIYKVWRSNMGIEVVISLSQRRDIHIINIWFGAIALCVWTCGRKKNIHVNPNPRERRSLHVKEMSCDL